MNSNTAQETQAYHPQIMKLRYCTTPGGTLFSTTPGGTRIIYDRKFLLDRRNSPMAQTPPCHLPNIPGVTSPGSVTEDSKVEVNNLNNHDGKPIIVGLKTKPSSCNIDLAPLTIICFQRASFGGTLTCWTSSVSPIGVLTLRFVTTACSLFRGSF
ncbi:eukaryotic translation initiation factor 4E-1A-binding protein homolog [Crotalus tigris]|uniref:eukaryotic translation initiation factor 4E-1A-binding protein homolog n=1 Tax=Crotalus tigris TaxID=88082 RepID=UPI00192F7E82|nr:eukaryotic translation initiation factor 4E-1A-binding protein homolog [Crotalus tigris]